MKITFYFFLLLFTGSLISGCKKDTPAKIPSITTTPATSITVVSATSGGTISSDGGAQITARGVCWGSSAEPTISDSKTSDGDGTGQFVSNITSLSGGTTYHIRAYATNSVGTAYGNDLTFVTLGQLPAATTQAASNITYSGATLNGSVNANDLATTVSFEYGITVSYGQTTDANPGQVTGNTVTNVSAAITGLSIGISYHFRLKAVNSLGTSYGTDMIFTAAGAAPVATTQAASNLSSTGATLMGLVNANGYATTISFEFGTTSSYGQVVPAVPAQIPGTYNIAVNAVLSGLSSNTTYHFRIKAVNSAGTSYGNDMNFTTTSVSSQVTDVDGNTYNTITIGTQTWLKENLKVTKYNDGTAIPNTTDNTAWSSTSANAYCDYSNTASYSTTYGKLYNWYVVASSNTKNVCPTGWHVPSDAQWATLITYLGGDVVAGGKLKETGTAHWLSPNTGATNETAFTALPGGYRSETGTFGLIGNSGYWWSSTEGGTTFSWDRYMNYNSGNAVRGDMDKNGGFSVRCLKN